MAGYEHFWDMISVEKTLYNSAIRKGLLEGHAEGHAEGLLKGHAEGLAEGEAKGLAEGQRLIAGNMKQQGINLETIAQCTGLSVEEIKEL